ncbi:MAG: VOC family protein [Candidatus Thorarchaeota archaeon]
MVKAIPYLLVKNGKKAIEIYKDLFDAKLIEHQPFSKEVGKEFGMPDDFDYENSTMHAKLDIGGAEVYLADNVMQRGNSPGIVEITLDLDTKEQIDKIYEKVKEKGCTIYMELEKTFWGAYFARFEDPEGIGWQLNYSENQ